MGCEIDEIGAPVEQEQRIVRTAPHSGNLGIPSSEKVENVALNSKAKLNGFEERSEGIVNARVEELGLRHDCPNSMATSSDKSAACSNALNNNGASGGNMVDRDPEARGAVGGSPPSGNNPRREIESETLKKLEELQGQLERYQDIPAILYEVPLSCLQERTIISLCYHLDVESEVMSPEGRLKDYRGMGEWIGLERVFIRYVIGASLQYKTKEIVSKWMTMEDVEADRKPTIRNLRQCLLDIDRPDVLEDMSVSISHDAVQWKRTNIEANLVQPKPVEDTSWQLTRHDVVSGKPAYYTCCLVYADEDERMAEVITKLYNRAYPESLFFRPQFDLKSGKYVYDTTAQVIEERCGGKAMFLISEYFLASDVCRFAVHFCKDMEGIVAKKKTYYTACLLYADEDELMADLIIGLYKKAYRDARFFVPQFDLKFGKWELDTTARIIDERCDKKVVFLLSEYFYASNICQFAVNYVAAHGTGHGNLIPFHLTRNVTSVPNVLKGIAGIRWFRKATRKYTWEILTDCLLAEKIASVELLEEIKENITKIVEKDSDYYLQDPPYDDDTGPPGEPIPVVEPESPSSSFLADFHQQEHAVEEKLAEEEAKKKQVKKAFKWKLLKRLQTAILEKVFKETFSKKKSSSDQYKMVPLTPVTQAIPPSPKSSEDPVKSKAAETMKKGTSETNKTTVKEETIYSRAGQQPELDTTPLIANKKTGTKQPEEDRIGFETEKQIKSEVVSSTIKTQSGSGLKQSILTDTQPEPLVSGTDKQRSNSCILQLTTSRPCNTFEETNLLETMSKTEKAASRNHAPSIRKETCENASLPETEVQAKPSRATCGEIQCDADNSKNSDTDGESNCLKDIDKVTVSSVKTENNRVRGELDINCCTAEVAPTRSDNLAGDINNLNLNKNNADDRVVCLNIPFTERISLLGKCGENNCVDNDKYDSIEANETDAFLQES